MKVSKLVLLALAGLVGSTLTATSAHAGMSQETENQCLETIFGGGEKSSKAALVNLGLKYDKFQAVLDEDMLALLNERMGDLASSSATCPEFKRSATEVVTKVNAAVELIGAGQDKLKEALK